jgi:hypothetical protein
MMLKLSHLVFSSTVLLGSSQDQPATATIADVETCIDVKTEELTSDIANMDMDVWTAILENPLAMAETLGCCGLGYADPDSLCTLDEQFNELTGMLDCYDEISGLKEGCDCKTFMSMIQGSQSMDLEAAGLSFDATTLEHCCKEGTTNEEFNQCFSGGGIMNCIDTDVGGLVEDVAGCQNNCGMYVELMKSFLSDCDTNPACTSDPETVDQMATAEACCNDGTSNKAFNCCANTPVARDCSDVPPIDGATQPGMDTTEPQPPTDIDTSEPPSDGVDATTTSDPPTDGVDATSDPPTDGVDTTSDPDGQPIQPVSGTFFISILTSFGIMSLATFSLF